MKRMIWVLIMLLCAMPVWAQDASQADAGYQEALRRIEEARMSGATELDLSRLALTGLPPQIGQLNELQVLVVSNNDITSLPSEIRQLSSLQAIFLNSNKLTTLPAEIGQLSNLVRLEAYFNLITSIPPEIGRLTFLEQLDLSHNRLKSLPPEIGYLASLYQLNLIDNELIALPSEIGQLTNLEYLAISWNDITSLPLAIGHLPLKTFYLPSETLMFPTFDIQAQGTPALLRYLRDYEAMLMRQTIVGIAAGVGGIEGLILAFRWRQQRGLSEKKKRL